MLDHARGWPVPKDLIIIITTTTTPPPPRSDFTSLIYSNAAPNLFQTLVQHQYSIAPGLTRPSSLPWKADDPLP